MFKNKKNNKIQLIVISIAVILLGVGASYAWWTASSVSTQTVAMGNLKIESKYANMDTQIFEPGLSAEFEGTITNKGSISAMIKVVSKSQIKFAYTDDNLTVDPNPIFVDDTEGAIKMSFAPTSGKYDDVEGAYWFQDATGNMYVLLDPGVTASVTNTALFDGEKMTNKFQDAEVKVGSNASATQVVEGAIKAEFNVNLSDLVGLSDTRSGVGTQSATRAQMRLNQLVNRK